MYSLKYHFKQVELYHNNFQKEIVNLPENAVNTPFVKNVDSVDNVDKCGVAAGRACKKHV